jgi:hypothetical protein
MGRGRICGALNRQALANETQGADFRCLHGPAGRRFLPATGSLRCDEAPGRIKRRMPEPVPLMVLGNWRYRGSWKKGIEPGLLKDAAQRTLNVSRQVGIRAIVVYALSEGAKSF